MFSKNFNISIKHFYFLILLLVIFESLHAWFFWPFNGYMITAAFALLTILVATINPKMFSFKRESVIILIIIFLLARVGAVRGNINAYFGALILSFNIILFIALNRKYQMEAVEYLLKALSIVFGISLLAWFMFLIGIPFPFFLDT